VESEVEFSIGCSVRLRGASYLYGNCSCTKLSQHPPSMSSSSLNLGKAHQHPVHPGAQQTLRHPSGESHSLDRHQTLEFRACRLVEAAGWQEPRLYFSESPGRHALASPECPSCAHAPRTAETQDESFPVACPRGCSFRRLWQHAKGAMVRPEISALHVSIVLVDRAFPATRARWNKLRTLPKLSETQRERPARGLVLSGWPIERPRYRHGCLGETEEVREPSIHDPLKRGA